MAEFRAVREQLKQARSQREAAEAALSRTKEQLRQIGADEAAFNRGVDPANPAHIGYLQVIRNQKSQVGAAILRQAQEVERLRGLEQEMSASFAPYSDPRTNLHRLDDAFPFLLFPIRLETRFKTIVTASGSQHQLWVRLYPDDCAIDTFEAMLSHAEIRNAQRYWQEVWRAGSVEDDERGAWRGLVGSHGSGRAAWIIAHYRPLNESERPKKARREDVVLVIPTHTPLTGPERNAVVTYWKSIWLADGNLMKKEAARDALRVAVGTSRTEQILVDYVPYNITDKPTPPATKNEVTVSVAFLLFPQQVESKQDAWTQPPKVNVFPDRFVLVAYAQGKKVLETVGKPVQSPVIVGPDPSAETREDQIYPENGELYTPDDIRWMVDFERAVQSGLGFRVTLSEIQAREGFDRLLVVGVRLSASAQDGADLLQQLLQHHHYSRSGLSLLPQGTPTNNIEGRGTDYTRTEDADATFDQYCAQRDLFEETDVALRKKDGQWLAELLGVDTAVFENVRHSNGTDQSEARAMQLALWPATLGYMMNTMLDTVFTIEDIDLTRWFFTEFVSGRGPLPAIRIGRQPYGILPTTAFSRVQWLPPSIVSGTQGEPLDQQRQFLSRLFEVLRRVDADWTEMVRKVSYVGKQGDAHEILLDILGLHPTSVEFHYRYGESLEQLSNRLNLEGLGNEFLSVVNENNALTMQLLRKLGYTGETAPELFKLFFLSSQGRLTGPLIDDRPLSETDGIRAYTEDEQNYIQWLMNAARSSLDTVRRQQGFRDDHLPQALLYLLLRHALLLGYYDASVALHRTANFLPSEMMQTMRREPAFIHVKEGVAPSESRWQMLFKIDLRVTHNRSQTVAGYITQHLGKLEVTRHLDEQIKGLEVLKDASTAALERAFVEHLDCCTYRFDAWLQGLVHYQLHAMRYQHQQNQTLVRKGVYLGAYGWLEDVRPDQKRQLTSFVLNDPNLAAIFQSNTPLFRDSNNGGYIHAPSLNHAVTAAILRNGYISHTSQDQAQLFSVNLSSERVRLALSMLEGMRNGQSVGALLGYRLERGLHDRHGRVELNRFIYALRKAFPLHADRLKSTKTNDTVAIEDIDARNVVDGLKLVEYLKKTGNQRYPFGVKILQQLPEPTPLEAQVINAEVNGLLDIYDALADLVLAEGVHQAVQGNFDRAAGALDVATQAHYPSVPAVIQTPTSGAMLLHRVAVHLETGLVPPVVDATPRSMAEPALNKWLAGVLPALETIACKVVWISPHTLAHSQCVVTLRDLKLQPIDLLYLIQLDHTQAMAELDDRILTRVISVASLRPDTSLSIHYMEKSERQVSIFEVTPLVRSLRALLRRARPLRASDLSLPHEVTEKQEQAVFVDSARIVQVKSAMDMLSRDLVIYLTKLESTVSELSPTARNALVSGIDIFLDDAVTLLARAARFGIPNTGWGFALEWKRTQFAALLEKVQKLVTRWRDKLHLFTEHMRRYDTLLPETPCVDKIDLLRTAERLVSTTLMQSASPPDELKAMVLRKQEKFAARLDQFARIFSAEGTSLASFLASVQALLPVTEFDVESCNVDETKEQVVLFARNLVQMMKSLLIEVNRRRTTAQAQLESYDATGAPSARATILEQAAHALLGEDFHLIPEFSLTSAQGDEWQNACSAATGGALLRYLVNSKEVDFPVDEWLYGIARVRESMRTWEHIVMLSGAFGCLEPTLTPLQFPFRSDDYWLALPFPEHYVLDNDRLLYTAHFATSFDKGKRQCGLLLDEWTEVVERQDREVIEHQVQSADTASRTTGVAFHFDRPNSEPPQTLLLVTPATWNGEWQWEDLVGALNETLDLAKKRAVEPTHIDASPYARFLPATIMAVTLRGISISTALAANNNVFDSINEQSHG